MKKNQTQIIAEGYSMGLVIPAMILLLISIFFYLINVWLGLFLSISAMSLLLVKTGIEVDVKGKQLRSFKEFLGYRIGSWWSL